MKIIQKINVKQVLTPKNKERLYKKFNLEKMELEKECQHLLFEQKRLEKKMNTDLSDRFDAERTKRQDKMKLLDFKVEQLQTLPLGSEIIEGEVDALVDVRVGSNWGEIQRDKAIILEDNIVVRIDR